jgi:hypothetical protein
LRDVVLQEAKEIAQAVPGKSGIEAMIIHKHTWKVHKSGTTGERFEAFHVTSSSHPPYSLDISLFHFCFFVWNKSAVQGQ